MPAILLAALSLAGGLLDSREFSVQWMRPSRLAALLQNVADPTIVAFKKVKLTSEDKRGIITLIGDASAISEVERLMMSLDSPRPAIDLSARMICRKAGLDRTLRTTIMRGGSISFDDEQADIYCLLAPRETLGDKVEILTFVSRGPQRLVRLILPQPTDKLVLTLDGNLQNYDPAKPPWDVKSNEDVLFIEVRARALARQDPGLPPPASKAAPATSKPRKVVKK